MLVPLAVQGMALVQGMGVANAIVIIMVINASFIMQGVWMKVIVTMVVVAVLGGTIWQGRPGVGRGRTRD